MAVPPNRLGTTDAHSLPVRLASAAIMAAAMLLGLWVVMMVVWGIA